MHWKMALGGKLIGAGGFLLFYANTPKNWEVQWKKKIRRVNFNLILRE